MEARKFVESRMYGGSLLFMKRSFFFRLLPLWLFAMTTAHTTLQSAEIRAGIIGLDTSHAPAFIKTLNKSGKTAEEEARFGGIRVVAAYPQGSRDIEASYSRVPKYTEDAKSQGVEIVDSIEKMLEKVDVVFLESNDGKVHWEQIQPVLKAKKSVFVDKPVAANFQDVLRIYGEAAKQGVPIFSSSSLRYGPMTKEVLAQGRDKIQRVVAHSPASIDPGHVDLYWYGIHGSEVLFTLLGKDLVSVKRGVDEEGLIHVVGKWSNGRVGEFYESNKSKRKGFGGIASTADGEKQVGDFKGYDLLLEQIVTFFKTKKAPVDPEETLALYAFMTAADESKKQNGKEINIQEFVAAEKAKLHSAK